MSTSYTTNIGHEKTPGIKQSYTLSGEIKARREEEMESEATPYLENMFQFVCPLLPLPVTMAFCLFMETLLNLRQKRCYLHPQDLSCLYLTFLDIVLDHMLW